MTKKISPVEEIKANLKAMEWDDLANNLIDLELEYEEIKLSLSKDQKSAFNLLILHYEEEKVSRLDKSFNHAKFVEDTQIVAHDWVDEIF